MPNPFAGYFDPAGAVLALTINDMIRFAMILTNQGNGVLSPASVTEMTSAHVSTGRASYGYGLFIDTVGGEPAVGHSGSTYGFTAHIETLPQRGLAVAVMVNGDRADPTRVAHQALALYQR